MKIIREQQAKWLLKKFHTIAAKSGMSAEDKKELVGSYGVESSKDLTIEQLGDACDKIERDLNPELIKLDKARLRLLGCIGGWFKALNKPANIAVIKAIATRAAKQENFNDIPLERLRSLYAAFSNKQKDMKMVDQITVDQLDILTLSN